MEFQLFCLFAWAEWLFLGFDATEWIAFLTFAYAVLTFFLWRAARRTIMEQNRPVVVASFLVRNRRLLLKLQNSGNRPALHVRVEFIPSLSEIALEESLDYGISFYKHLLKTDLLTSNEIREGLILLTPQLDRLYPDGKVFSVGLTYSDMNEKKYSASYTLNTSDSVTSGSPANVDHFGQLIKKLDENFDRLLEFIQSK